MKTGQSWWGGGAGRSLSLLGLPEVPKARALCCDHRGPGAFPQPPLGGHWAMAAAAGMEVEGGRAGQEGLLRLAVTFTNISKTSCFFSAVATDAKQMLLVFTGQSVSPQPP